MGTITEDQPTTSQDNPLAAQSDNIVHVCEILRNSRGTFFALILACVYSFLAIATTTDAALLSNSSGTPLPIIQVNVPIVWFYYFAPVILAALFIYFHLYLERFWRCVTRLPLYHPDGRGLDDYVYPWLITSAFIRGEMPLLSNRRISARLEAWLSLMLAWWLIPVVLLFYWGRYLVAHDWVGTSVHIALILIVVGFAMRFFFIAKNSLRAMAGSTRTKAGEPVRDLHIMQVMSATLSLLILAVALTYTSAAASWGIPDEHCRTARAESWCGFFSPGHDFWKAVGVEPYSQVAEEKFVSKPKNWRELLLNRDAVRNYLDGQRTLALIRKDMRGMNAQEAFLPGSQIDASTLEYAELQHAVITGSRLNNVNLRGANLTDSDFQHTVIVDSRFEEVIALAARFNHARFSGTTSESRTSLSGDFSGASFDHASGDRLLLGNRDQGETSLRETSLVETNFTWSEFKNVDFGEAGIDNATLTHSTFDGADFSGTRIRNGSILNHSTFKDCRFIASRIQDSFFEEAEFTESEFGQIEHGESTSPAFRPTIFEQFRGFGVKFGRGSRMRNVRFVKADLRFAVFENVEFQNTLFSDTDLSGARFRDVDLNGVDFERVDLSGANLEDARNVLPELLDGACGNAETQLPTETPVKVKPCLNNSP